MIVTMEQVFGRMNGSAALKAVVGLDENDDINAQPDWPDTNTDWDTAPALVTYIIPFGENIHAVNETSVQIDIFVPRRLGTEVAGDIETELRTLFHRQTWTDVDSGQRVYTTVGSGSSRPSSYRDPVHFMLEVAVRATD